MDRALLFLLLIAAAAALFSCRPARAGIAPDTGAELRRRLFQIERQLERKVPERPMSLREMLLEGMDQDWTDIGEISLGSAGEKGGGKENVDGKKEPGNVNVSLGGGKLTGYSRSTTGLDLSDTAGGGLKLMLRDESIDLESLEKDGSMRDSFSAANREKFYGLGNYERFKDLFENEEKTKDYTIMGVGLDMDIGDGLSLGMLNYSKPPKRKKIVFFGNETGGPFRLQATNIIPGSEIVKTGGSERTRGTDYEINYTRGEITFSAPVADSERVLVEYELADGAGSEPGRFTGFRIETVKKEDGKEEGVTAETQRTPIKEEDEKNDETQSAQRKEEKDSFGKYRLGPLSLEKWGVSYLTDEVVTYRSAGDGISRREVDHQLMGFDGSLSILKNTRVDFELAQSAGNKQSEIGRYARETFSITDSRTSDGNPMGPYQLDESKLPVVEGSDEVKMNGELLKRDEDYTLDPVYGTLRLKKKDLNLSSLDVIEVEYRYLTEEDRLAGETESRKDMAGLFSIENTFGKLKHRYALDRRGADFMLVGGRSGNQLKNEEQELSWDSGKGFNAVWGRTLGVSLQDGGTGLTRTDCGGRFSVDYKNDALQLSFKRDEKERYDNLAVRETENEKENTAFSASYRPGKKWGVSFDGTRSAGNDLRGGKESSTISNDKSIQIDGKPTKNLDLNFRFGRGADGNETAGTTRETEKSSRNVSAKYKAGKNLQLSFDSSSNDFSNAVTAAETGASTAATGTPETGNRETKWSLRYQPSVNTTLTLRLTDGRQDQVTGVTDRSQSALDVRHKINEKTDLQYQRTAMESGRPGQEQSTENESISVRTKFSWFDGMEITLKHDRQASSVERIAESATRTDAASISDGVSVKCFPFWKDRSLSVEYRDKRGDQLTSGQAPGGDREKTWKTGMEIPFFGESFIALNRETSRKTGGRAIGQERTEVSLNGNPAAGAALQFSYRSEVFTDAVSPQTSRRDSSLNLMVKMERKW
jgi:hypothetical protein